MVQIENCGGYISNWFFTYQHYCSIPNTLELTWLGRLALGIILILFVLYLRRFIPISSSTKE